MGDRRQPTPVDPTQVKPEPPPAPPAKRYTDGGSAFPLRLPNLALLPDEAYEVVKSNAGMSKRDYFAAKALNGLIGRATVTGEPVEQIADTAYRLADAMLAERERAQ